MTTQTQTVQVKIYDCSREYPDCFENTDHDIDIDDAAAVQALADRVASDCKGDPEAEDWNILVCIETEDGDELARATTTNDHAEYIQDSMDETYELIREYQTDCVGIRDGEWFRWSRNGGRKGAHDRMTNQGWRERYETPAALDVMEAREALVEVAGMTPMEAAEKLGLKVSIGDEAGLWCGDGTIKAGSIECSAVLGDDQDASDEIYEAIEESIEAGQTEGEVSGYKWTLEE